MDKGLSIKALFALFAVEIIDLILVNILIINNVIYEHRNLFKDFPIGFRFA